MRQRAILPLLLCKGALRAETFLGRLREEKNTESAQISVKLHHCRFISDLLSGNWQQCRKSIQRLILGAGTSQIVQVQPGTTPTIPIYVLSASNRATIATQSSLTMS